MEEAKERLRVEKERVLKEFEEYKAEKEAKEIEMKLEIEGLREELEKMKWSEEETLNKNEVMKGELEAKNAEIE